MIKWLSHIIDSDAALAGAKALNLARLVRMGFPVPRGFCVTTSAFREFMGQRPRENPLSRPSLEEVCSLPMPERVRAEVEKALARLGSGKAFAVRSSATCEDGRHLSGAGMFDTFLDVSSPGEVITAVKACWASLFSERAMTYFNNSPLESASMAVVIQEMVEAEFSGVLFSANPQNGCRGVLVIEASHGTGDTVVSGRTSPERVIIWKKNLRPLFGTAGATTKGEPFYRALFEKRAIKSLGASAKRLERHFNYPVDIEWALSGGRLFLLQVRPITALPDPKTPEVWSNVNSGEVLPDAVTPLTWSIVKVFVASIFSPVNELFGIDVEKEPVFDLIEGHAYANASIFAWIIHCIPGPGRPSLTEVFGGEQEELLEELFASFPDESLRGRRPFTLSALARLPVSVARFLFHARLDRSRNFFKLSGDEIDALLRLDLSSRSVAELLDQVDMLMERILGIRNVVPKIATGMGYFAAFLGFCRKYLGDPHGMIANRLVAGTGNMDSAEGGMAIYRLAEEAFKSGEVGAALRQEESFSEIRGILEGSGVGKAFLAKWDEMMLRHGHHTRGEVELYNPRWSEEPDYVLHLLRGYLETMTAPSSPGGEKNDGREALLAQCRGKLRNPLLCGLFLFLLQNARKGVCVRENAKSEAVRLLAVLRKTVLELGERARELAYLQKRDDIFFLEKGELRPLFESSGSLTAGELVASRRAEYERNRQVVLPPVLAGERSQWSRAVRRERGPQRELRGISVSAGTATGPARVILLHDLEERVMPGEILVAPFTDPGWTPYFVTAAALVTDLGGVLSHGSIVAREYGIPAVVNVGSATKVIRTGQVITVDGNRGIVTIAEGMEQQGNHEPPGKSPQ
ncbi:MAG: PEP/pyruvate-binding domain-containing protein [Candidatus Eremiobacteraeota bacterium]|nr:PEP/pyruvate-binding domain-containing protein [Candidatus Eremiobacteraeota bacterium]